MEKQKKILIPGGKLSDWALVNSAHKLGMYVITSGTDKKAPAHQFSDKYVCADYSDKEAMLKLAKDENIDYMCTCANDFGMLSTAYVCEKLGLPGHDSYETTLDIHTKDRFKPIAKKLGIHAPISEVFDNREDAIKFIKSSTNEMIIKPCDNVASHGVSHPKSKDEIEKCVDEAFNYSKEKKILVEPFIEGDFATVTSYIINEEVVAFFANSSYKYPQGEVIGPEFPDNELCNGGTEPSIGFKKFSPAIIDDFNKIAKELHLVDGKFHCELKIDKDFNAHIFDVHRRMSGEPTPWHEWNETIGFSWTDWIVKAECGMDLSEFPRNAKQNKFIHNRDIYVPKNGILKRVIFDEYLTSHMYYKIPGIKNYVLFNEFVSDYRHNPIVKGMKFVFDTDEEMEFVASYKEDNFYKHITFEYEEF